MCGAPTPNRTGDGSFADFCLNRLGYRRDKMELVDGFKPTSSAWKAEAQSLYHTSMERTTGNDPATSALATPRSAN